MILWQYPLAFASGTAPMDLTDREELSRALKDAPDASDARAYTWLSVQWRLGQRSGVR